VNHEITPADMEDIDTLNYIIRLALGVAILCVIGIAYLEGFL
jgi:hypothetical protein